MKKMTILLSILAVSSAGATRTAENLKGFRNVCVNASFEEKGKENEAVRGKLITRLEAALKKANIAVAPGECGPKGLTANRQVNLFFSFFTTDDGDIYQASLEGWLSKEGNYKEVTLWSDLYIGGLDVGGGSLEAADLADELVADFIADWKKTTH
ncbi:hypothetical protein D3875_12800 [Deinococcus cavernae]|uniref:Uncharacterized protein n=1 Tax=Deinococcus cavernae TaxID=2320857 RepID=A0A418V878_9DEIO|nr:hypothetical protein [Deinococcus cavernae]RJF72298.1 hypothetical protein D3875_12800 [Deinococcus cavernae]